MPQDTSESALEQTFSDLANARLRDKSPVLLDYLVGFQLIDADEDGGRAVGMFAFEIGGDWHYSPVFFLNGEIKGLDSIYSVNSDLFVPLSEDWVNSIINRRPTVLGEADKRNRVQRGVRTPDYNRLRTLPAGIYDGDGGGSSLSKRAAARKSAGDCPVVPIHKITHIRKIAGAIDLPSGLEAMGHDVASMFLDTIVNPQTAGHVKLANAVRKFYPDLAFTVPGVVKLAAEQKGEPITVISTIDQEGVDDLTDAQRKQILEGDVAVVDKRPEMSKSIVYSTQTKQQLTSPTGGGLYDVLYSDGSVEPTLVVPMSQDNGRVFVIRCSDEKTCITAVGVISTLRQYTETDFAKELEKVSVGADKVRPGDQVIFVANDGGKTSPPLDVLTTVSDDGITTYKTHGGSSWDLRSIPERFAHKDRGVFAINRPLGYIGEHDCDQVIVSAAGNRGLKKTNSTLYVNSKYYSAVVYGNREDDYKVSWSDREKARLEKHLEASDFGDHNTIIEVLKKQASAVKVWTDETSINIKDDFGSHSFGKTAAISYLMKKHGCSEVDTRSMLKHALRAPQNWLIKQAASENMMAFPDINDTSEGGVMSSFHTTKVPWETQARPAQIPDNRQQYQYFSPFGHGDAENEGGGDPFDAIDQAAKTGQKEVFDSAVLGSLTKAHAPIEMIERFLPTIVAGMDRLGRILFLMHWHYDEFQEKFGKEDSVELGDNLKSSFEGLGDLVIFLRKRTLSGDPEFYGLGINSTMDG